MVGAAGVVAQARRPPPVGPAALRRRRLALPPRPGARRAEDARLGRSRAAAAGRSEERPVGCPGVVAALAVVGGEALLAHAPAEPTLVAGPLGVGR